MMADPMPHDAPRTKRGGDNVTLTPDDEAALSAAWDSITSADIEASIHWLKTLTLANRLNKERPNG